MHAITHYEGRFNDKYLIIAVPTRNVLLLNVIKMQLENPDKEYTIAFSRALCDSKLQGFESDNSLSNYYLAAKPAGTKLKQQSWFVISKEGKCIGKDVADWRRNYNNYIAYIGIHIPNFKV